MPPRADPTAMIIECPAPGCARRFMKGGAALGFVGGRFRQPSTTECRKCGQVIQVGLLVLDADEIWRVSPFAGHADDVRLSEPPGGEVSYAPEERPAVGPPAAEPPARESQARERALSAIEGRASRVGAGAQRDAVELALELGVLDDEEAARARTWLERQ